MSIFEKIMLAIRNYVEKNNVDNQDYKIYVRKNQEAIISMLKKIPAFHEPAVATRTILIAYAFEAGLSLDELEELIAKYQCEKLYARNLEEYCLMYALNHHKSYKEWIRLVKKAQVIRAEFNNQISKNTIDLKLSNSKEAGKKGKENSKDRITVQYLRDYISSVRDFSEDSNGRSKEITFYLKRSALENQTDEDFADAIINNMAKFVGNRETARRKLVGELLATIDYWQSKGDPVPWVAHSGKRSVKCDSLVKGFNFTFPGLIVNERKRISYKDEDDIDAVVNTFLNICADPDTSKTPISQISDHLSMVLAGTADINRTLFIFLLVFLQADMEEQKSIQDINNMLFSCGWETMKETNVMDKLAMNCMQCLKPEKVADNLNAIEIYWYLYHGVYKITFINDRYVILGLSKDDNGSTIDTDSVIRATYKWANIDIPHAKYLISDLIGNLKNRTKGENFAKAIQTQTNEHKE